MKRPMIIIEKEHKASEDITAWAKIHSVPIVNMDSFSTGKTKGNDFSDFEYVIEYSEEITLEYIETAYSHAIGQPAVIGETEQLMIREIGMDDVKKYQTILELFPEAVSDKTLLNLNGKEFAERHQAYMKYSYGFLGYGIYGIFLRADTAVKMIGIAGLDGTETPSLSYALLEEYRGKGYAYEACCLIIEYAMANLDLDKINIFIRQDNTRSINLAKKLQGKYPILRIGVRSL